MPKNIYEISVEVKPKLGSGFPVNLLGAFVYCYVPADSLEQSIIIMKETLANDHYELVDIEYCAKLDMDEWQPNEQNFPSAQDLDSLDIGEIYYSPFYGYQSHYEH